MINFQYKPKNYFTFFIKLYLVIAFIGLVITLYVCPGLSIFNFTKLNIPAVKLLQSSGVDVNNWIIESSTPRQGARCNHRFLDKNPLALALFKNDAKTFIDLYEQGLDIDFIMPCNRGASPRGILISKLLAGDIKLKELQKSEKLYREMSDAYNKITDQSSIEAIYSPPLKHPKAPSESQIITDGYNVGIEKYGDGYIVAYRSDVIDIIARDKNGSMLNKSETLGYYYANNYYINRVAGYYPTIQLEQFDSNFQRSSQVYDITGDFERHNIIPSAEDPRLFSYNKSLYMLFNMDNIGGSRSMYLAEIINKNSAPTIANYKRLQSPFDSKIEKNWSPLIHNNKLYFLYAYEPNLILIEPNINTGTSSVIASIPNRIMSGYGQVRGGTQFVPIGDGAYLSIAHSSIEVKNTVPKKNRSVKFVYFAYPTIIKFEANGEVKYINDINKNPIFARTITYNKATEKDVFFPSGLVDNGKELILTSGVNDQHSSLIVINKEKFLKQIGYTK